MKLSEILSGIPISSDTKYIDMEISYISDNSNDIKDRSVFIACKGEQHDGHIYIEDAIKRGALVIIFDNDKYYRYDDKVSFIKVENSRKILSRLGSNFYKDPSSKLDLVGVTGTNGKTTITYLLESILKEFGKSASRIGTTGYSISGENFETRTTTPGVLELNKILYDIYKAATDVAVLEVSSHALKQHRVDGMKFKIAIFTNLTQDHLDYHVDMEDYFLSKSILFKDFSVDVSIINIDDSYAKRVISLAKGNIIKYGFSKDADIYPLKYEIGIDGISADIYYKDDVIDIKSRLIGFHNIYNIMGSILAANALGVPVDIIKRGICNLKVVPGRSEVIDEGQPYTVIVDYAHTPDALENTLKSLRSLLKGDLITVFGCGGDRDKGKRSKMGKVASSFSDHLVITSDNPRTESPAAIIDDIARGIKENENLISKFEIIPDRREAIFSAIEKAQKDDLVLIAGKGHENYQIIGLVKNAFDDRLVSREAIRSREAKV